MSRKKKVIIASVSVFLVLALAAGAVLILPRLNQKPVDVYPVERIREYAQGNPLGSSGSITSGNLQEVYLDTELLLDGIEVSEGDTVALGDVLMRYDMTIQNLGIRTIQINIQILETQIKKAEGELAELKKLVASSPPPPPPIPEHITVGDITAEPVSAEDPQIVQKPLPYGGTGTAEDPFRYDCMDGAAVTEAFLENLRLTVDAAPEKPAFYLLDVYYGNFVKLFSWKLDGSKLPADPEEIADWDLSAGVAVGGDDAVDASARPALPYAEFTQHASTVDYIGGPHYSQAEIDRMVTAKDNELAGFRTGLKQERLNLEKAESESGDGTVLSKIDGIVASVNDPENLEEGQPVIVVQSGRGYRVEGSVSELNLGNIKVGQEVTVNSWQTGGSYAAVISEISDFPARGNSGTMGMENPVNSYYTFVATIETDEVLTIGEWVEIYISGGGGGMREQDDTLYLPNAFIREENGQSYVMKADGEGKLVRQYITTGKSNYGYSTEIKGGITLEDTVAFPYAKEAREGAPTVVAEGYYW